MGFLLVLSTSMIHQKDADVLLRPMLLVSSGRLFDPVTVSPASPPIRPPTLSTAVGLICFLPDLIPRRPCSEILQTLLYSMALLYLWISVVGSFLPILQKDSRVFGCARKNYGVCWAQPVIKPNICLLSKQGSQVQIQNGLRHFCDYLQIWS